MKRIFFIKEEYASSLNKLAFAIWCDGHIGIWHLEFAGNKFDGAKMFNVFTLDLPDKTLHVSIKHDEMIVYTCNSLTTYILLKDFSVISKKNS